MDETRELIEVDEEKQVFCTYCFGLKTMYDIREGSAQFCLCSICALPFVIIADTVALLPQMIYNNIKLCFN